MLRVDPTMTNAWKRTLAATALALAATLTVSGCAAQSIPSDGDTNAGQTTKEQTQAPAAKGELTAENFAERINDAQMKAGSVSYQQTVEMQGTTITSNGRMILDDDASKIRMALTTEMGGQPSMEMRMVDGVMYMSMGELTEGKFITLDGGDDPMSAQLEQSLDEANISEQMNALQDAIIDLTATDGGTIDGVATTLYTLTLDTAKMFADKGVNPADANLGDTLTYDMYIGGDDLIRRMVMDIAGAQTVTDYTGWGEPVSIDAPTADEITDKSLFDF